MKQELARVEHRAGDTVVMLILWSDGSVTWDSIFHDQKVYSPTRDKSLVQQRREAEKLGLVDRLGTY